MQKYISLFPSTQTDDAPSSSTSPPTSETDAKREEIRSTVRIQMQEGQLPSEPESTEKRDQRAGRKNLQAQSQAQTHDHGHGAPQGRSSVPSTHVRRSGEKEKGLSNLNVVDKQADVSMEVDDFFESAEDDGSESDASGDE